MNVVDNKMMNDKDKLSVIKDTRVPVALIVGHLAAGDTMAKVMEEYRISKEQIMAAIKLAK